MSKIEFTRLTFGYDEQGTDLFTNTNLTIDTHWKLGLIGRNGRGKTTLLKLLMQEVAYQGTITHQQSFAYFPQTIKNKEQLIYYILQELTTCEQWEIERELNLLELSPDLLWRTFSSLSGGEQTKVLLAVLFVEKETFPLIDEPTNHLDYQSRLHIAHYLKKKRQGFIVVSHDRTFINCIVDHIMEIEKNRIELYRGNFSSYDDQKKRKDSVEREENEQLKKEVQRLKQTAHEKAGWAQTKEGEKLGNPLKKGSAVTGDKVFIGSRAARTMKRSKTLQTRMNARLEEKERLMKNIEHIEPLTINYQTDYHKQLLSVEHLQLSYEQKQLFQPLSFELREGDRLALTGGNGSGKTAVIKAIQGRFAGNSSGAIHYPKNLKISYVHQNYEELTGTLQSLAEKKELDYPLFLSNLYKLGLERAVFQTPIEKMSMGQRKRIEIAQALSQPASLYIWDEPLNYLDLFNQKQLEQLLSARQPTMLFIEHDRTFLKKLPQKP